MSPSLVAPRSTRPVAAAAATLLFGALTLLSPGAARAEDPKPAAPAAPAAAAATPAKGFPSKEEAAKALIEACAKNDDDALKALFGSTSADLVQSGKDMEAEKDRAGFAKAAARKLTFEEDGGKTVLVVGDEEWPCPVPLVKDGDVWRFDAETGRKEMLARRIGENELTAIQICKDYIEAQAAYASKDRDGDKVREFAQKLLSTTGQHDGLYWGDATADDPSPFGAMLSPYKDFMDGTGAAPFKGYYWRILKQQGDKAPGGAHSYVINGNMIAGFALLGVPADYRKTGVMTFIVSNHGTVYQKDLGANTLELAKSITTFDPDETWDEGDDNDPNPSGTPASK